MKVLKVSIIFMILISISISTECQSEPKLVWDANTESDLAGYRIYWDSGELNKTTSNMYEVDSTESNPQVGLSVLGVSRDVDLNYAVTAFDLSGNESGFSNVVVFNWDLVPPSDPGGCRMIR